MRSRPRLFFLVLLAAVILMNASARGDSPSRISIDLPRVAVAEIGFRIACSGAEGDSIPYTLSIWKGDTRVYNRTGRLPDEVRDVVLSRSGVHRVVVETELGTSEEEIRTIPGFLTLLPPVMAIAMALIFRQVVLALFVGVWLGAFLVNDFHPVRSFFYVVDHYAVDSLAGESGFDHVSIAIFTLLLGGMVGVFSSIGGTQGIVNQISRIATNDRRGQIATWLMGIAVFFDDYTNTLIVGNTMRPITDKLRISREKLSFIVDATAAPITAVAVITSWIGFEISLVKDAFTAAGIERNPFTTFVASIQYSFYPLLALLFGLLVAILQRDFGPMLTAERRSRETGRLLSEKAVPLSNLEAEIAVSSRAKPRWYNAAIPVAIVVFGTLAGLVITGRSALLERGVTDFTLMDAFRESNSFVALLWSSLAGCTAAILLGVGQRLATLSEALQAWIAGVRSMLLAIVILVLAWCIGAVCADLNTPGYLVAKLSGLITPGLLPAIVFLVAAAISFSTGTSWGTMTILTPITIPLVYRISELAMLSPAHHEAVLLSSIAAILSGSVFGDHCSPISDTTIMSSMASAADHIDHVRTQLPYAAVVGVVAALLGYLPAGFAFPSAASLAVGAAVIVAVLLLWGKKPFGAPASNRE